MGALLAFLSFLASFLASFLSSLAAFLPFLAFSLFGLDLRLARTIASDGSSLSLLLAFALIRVILAIFLPFKKVCYQTVNRSIAEKRERVKAEIIEGLGGGRYNTYAG